VIDEVQFPRIGDADDLAGKIALPGAHLGDSGVLRQVIEEDGPGWQHDAVSKVDLLELGSRLDQTFAPEALLIVGFFQLDAIPKFPRHPGPERAHDAKPLGPSWLNHRSRSAKGGFIGMCPAGGRQSCA
jgi:hypothetical protein